MNFQNFKIAKSFIKNFLRLAVFFTFFFTNIKVKAWDIDFSKRQVDFTSVKDERIPASQNTVETATENEAADTAIDMIASALKPIEPSQEVIIMQTAQGFVPDKIQLTKGVTYRFHIVNLDPQFKNTSFLFDAFSQSHNTVYGQPKSFVVTPRAEGLFSYQSPETSRQGQVVIVDDVRSPASVKLNAQEFKEKIINSKSSKTQKIEANNTDKNKSLPLTTKTPEVTVEDLLIQNSKD